MQMDYGASKLPYETSLENTQRCNLERNSTPRDNSSFFCNRLLYASILVSVPPSIIMASLNRLIHYDHVVRLTMPPQKKHSILSGDHIYKFSYPRFCYK